jgi:glycosyltransferase involved in cell wall biosynthesis
VAISHNQASTQPDIPWAGIVYHGLTFDESAFREERDESLVFVGRICEEKGVLDAIEVARLTGRRLRIAAKIGPGPVEQAYANDVFKPALARADTEFLGELTGPERERLIGGSYALVMPGAWPEPFGLVAIESLACGTPVIARRVGALPELIRHGVDGFLADDPAQMAFLIDRVAELDRSAVRTRALAQFSASRMVDDYEEVYYRMLADRRLGGSREWDRATDELQRATRIVAGSRTVEARLRPTAMSTRRTAKPTHPALGRSRRDR